MKFEEIKDPVVHPNMNEIKVQVSNLLVQVLELENLYGKASDSHFIILKYLWILCMSKWLAVI